MRKSNWLLNTDKYSKKELVCNWIIAFSWVIGLVLAIIIGGINWDYLKSLTSTNIILPPSYFQNVCSIAFIFIFASLFACFFKWKYAKNRKNGKLLSVEQAKKGFN
jgi:ABC-type uncharacterized transport system permease subunit